MIGYLSGKIIAKSPERVLLDVQGVGYELSVPASSLCSLPKQGEHAQLFVYTHVREDALRLFGFSSEFDRWVFEQLISVSNVGPKSALMLLGPYSGQDLCKRIAAGAAGELTSIPGVGAKTAERLVLELKSKLQKAASLGPEPLFESPQTAVFSEVQSALVNLGYKEKEVQKAIESLDKRVGSERTSWSLETTLRELLRVLSMNKLQ